MDLIVLAVLAGVALLAVAASLWGAESRPSFLDPRDTDDWSTIA